MVLLAKLENSKHETLGFSLLETVLKNDRGHNFTLLSKNPAGLKCLAFAKKFDTKYAGFSCENTAQRPRNRFLL